jgi:4-hydroxy-tetrahydrodipicolinate reductase
MINIILHGCSGRMGQVVAQVAATDPEIRIVAGVDYLPGSNNLNFPTYTSFEACTETASVIIDFSSPNAIQKLLQSACRRKVPLVIATTGLSSDDLKAVKTASEVIPILRSANMSLGVNLMYELSQKAASCLGDKFDIEIIEKHHNQKADSPSGTAYALADAINEAFLNPKNYVYGRNSKHQKRTADEIGIHAIRAGTINGEHTALFAGKDEALSITHTAYSRQIFASGAIAAAKYVITKPPGLYGFKDMLSEHSAVTNIDIVDGQSLITINHIPYNPRTIADIFSNIAKENINIDMISQTAPINGVVDISFTLPLKLLHRAMDRILALKKVIPSLSPVAYDNVCKLTIEGVGMEIQSGIAARIFDILAKQNISIKTITTSETKISCIIEKADELLAVKAISEEFGI